MNPSNSKLAEKLFRAVTAGKTPKTKAEVVVCPPFIYLPKLRKISKKITLGAQDCSWEGDGAYTGEVSASMVYDAGARYVILGHSERRAMGETNELINRKIKTAVKEGLKPILCVGERERDEGHEYFNIVETQVKECLNGVSKSSLSSIIVAYEPIWSISTTAGHHDATAFDSNEMTLFIRKVLSDISSPSIASKIRVIYGGSVNDKNAEGFLTNGGVDGLLPGHASLDAQKFLEIVKIASSAKR